MLHVWTSLIESNFEKKRFWNNCGSLHKICSFAIEIVYGLENSWKINLIFIKAVYEIQNEKFPQSFSKFLRTHNVSIIVTTFNGPLNCTTSIMTCFERKLEKLNLKFTFTTCEFVLRIIKMFAFHMLSFNFNPREQDERNFESSGNSASCLWSFNRFNNFSKLNEFEVSWKLKAVSSSNKSFVRQHQYLMSDVIYSWVSARRKSERRQK